MKFTVYKHTNSLTNKCHIGWTSKSIDQRWNKHVECSRNGSSYFHRSIKKYGIDCWLHETLAIAESKKEAKNLEIQFIAEHKSNDSKFGYNGTSGGDASVPNDETRKKLSIAQKARYENPEERLKISLGAKKRPQVSSETRQKLSNQKKGAKNPAYGKFGKDSCRFGKRHSDETKERIRQKKLGFKLSKEAKKKCSEASKRRWDNYRNEQKLS